MPSAPPSVVILAGPNGAGKSTIGAASLADFSDVSEFLDADAFARRLSRPPSQGDAIAAGRAMLRRLAELTRERRSFGFETTLASRTFAPKIRSLVRDGYHFAKLLRDLQIFDDHMAHVRQFARAAAVDRQS